MVHVQFSVTERGHLETEKTQVNLSVGCSLCRGSLWPSAGS